jgi:hypothetical protein
MKVRGISLFELLVVVAMGGLIAAGAARAFVAGVDFQARVVPGREDHLSRQRFEDGLARLLRQAYISTNEQDATTYFVAGVGGGDSGVGTTPGADTLIFTVLGSPPPASFMASEEDFETRNDTYGPQGGAAEIQISTFPVGEAGERTGLFLREQRPSDGDPYQGGTETVLDERVSSMTFEFWNGEAWTYEWDTITQGERRLPAAVRVTYTFAGEVDTNHIFIVRLPLSDVTPDNPLGVGGGGGGQ